MIKQQAPAKSSEIFPKSLCADGRAEWDALMHKLEPQGAPVRESLPDTSDGAEDKKRHKDGSIMGHKWERAQLGQAPFTFLYMTEKAIPLGDGTSQAAGTCQYCGTGIRYCYYVKSADGNEFYVGSDCIKYLGDEKLVAVVMSAERKRKNALASEKRRQKWVAEKARQDAEVERRMPEYLEALAKLESLPHPTPYFAAQGKTLADYYRYFEGDGKPSYWKQSEAISKAKGE